MRAVMSIALLIGACQSNAPDLEDTDGAGPDYSLAGDAVVGTVALDATDSTRDRTLHLQLWYPATDSSRDDANTGFPLESFGVGDEVATLETLLATAPTPGTLRTAHAARDAEPADGEPWPLIAFSHCLDCTRFSTFEIAERLASHGFAVLGVEHTGGTLYDRQAGTAAPLGAEFLHMRAADVSFALDVALDGADALPVSLRGHFDAERVGVFGHSFGGITTGRVLMLDPRPKAGLTIGAPMENVLVPGVTLADLHVPLLFMVATEDNSITELGNTNIRQNFAAANAPAYLWELADAGHYSFTTICGLLPEFNQGCSGDAKRQTDGEPFRYRDITRVRDLTATYVTRFFAATLRGEAQAEASLTAPPDDPALTVDARTTGSTEQ